MAISMPATPAVRSKLRDHDKTAMRLTQILVKLNQGEALDLRQLAEEFAVSLRTIQRDLLDRFTFLPLEKTTRGYRLDPTYLGKFKLRDMERFAILAGVSKLYPALTGDFLRDLLNHRLQDALLVKGPHFEDLTGKEHDFALLQQAIQGRYPITYSYSKPEGVKTYTRAKPYKLVNHDGIWYLAAKDGGTLKAFTFSKMDRLQVHDAADERFAPDAAVEQTLASEDDIWLNPQKIAVTLRIAPAIASYFNRRKLVANQVVVETLADGGLIVSSKVAHANQILPIVRSWIPHIRILSPEGLQAEMERELRGYLDAV
jgi:predicted DNA-binding transcriptional regulator YafY